MDIEELSNPENVVNASGEFHVGSVKFCWRGFEVPSGVHLAIFQDHNEPEKFLKLEGANAQDRKGNLPLTVFLEIDKPKTP